MRSTTRSPSRRSASTTWFENLRGRRPVRGPSRFRLRPRRRHQSGAWPAYAQTLGTVFTEAQKPYEVEIIVAEVGADGASDQLYR